MARVFKSSQIATNYALESDFNVLPATPTWYKLEPNNFADFGYTGSTSPRSYFDGTRQPRRGGPTDLESAVGFNQDLTVGNSWPLLQGFLYADVREKPTTAPLNSTATVVTGATGSNSYTADSGLDIFPVGALILGSNFLNPENNVVSEVVSSSSTALDVSSTLVAENPPANARLDMVGFRFPSSYVDATVEASRTRLTRTNTAVDFTTFGINLGELIYIGGDTASSRFDDSSLNGYARVRDVQEEYIELDKGPHGTVSETATPKTIELYFGDVIKNEVSTNLIKTFSYQFERQLGDDGSGQVSEYVTGATPNDLTINFNLSDKVTCDYVFVGCNYEARDSVQGIKSGNRVDATAEDAFTTTASVKRLKVKTVENGYVSTSDVFDYAKSLTFTVNNNAERQKSLGQLGAFCASYGMVEASIELQGYLKDVSLMNYFKDNTQITMEYWLIRPASDTYAKGIAVDIPSMTLDPQNIDTSNNSIEYNLSANAEGDRLFNHMILICNFKALPLSAAN